jgi:predicted metal-dependent phosphoesterase TrpH
MRIDLHCHSKNSHDNFLEPEDVIRQAVEKGLDGVCFTEHYSLMASLPVSEIQTPEGFYAFRGVEISTHLGHILAFGLKDDSWNKWWRNNFLNLKEVIEAVHALGGICVAAHPFRGWDSLGDHVYDIDGLDAIETHNGVNREDQNYKAMLASRIKNLPSTGGSDCHRPDQVGSAFTEFLNPVRSMEELVTEIKKGNCLGRVIEAK